MKEYLNKETIKTMTNQTNKELYYIPKIEELFIGYEAEWHQLEYDEFDNLTFTNWKPTILTKEYLNLIIMGITTLEDLKKSIRTPFLTKEQIEGEGWDFIGSGVGLFFKKEIKELKYNMFKQDNLIWISSDRGDIDNGFQGSCPSINEFRTIIKLLGI